MNQEAPIDVLRRFSPLTYADVIYSLFLKSLFVVTFFLYAAFAFLMIRQVRLMGQTVKTSLEPVLFIIAVAHFIIALLLFLAVLFLL